MTKQLEFRKPTAKDGSNICDLIEACKPLDENSMYCNLIQCDHFADTCIVAEQDGQIVGWISGHIPPSQEDTLFVWQVAVHPDARGIGLAGRMLADLIERDELDDVKQIQTTITGDNDASWGLFKGFAKRIGADVSDEPHFTRKDHFDGRHATEHMVTIAFREALRKAA
ncbi:diaminobutyrate acetyltransferase [Primorskyibacter marinus]|uniref:diaminobutyrate acetyltransferase n=1 Tax=Primorskyibacter marinus TaxID=1977320 RepID=UPI000E301050|nr:diaminobutyrate acetyltransferase [Primorskyibacter marinus]